VNTVFPTAQLEQEICMSSVRATGVSSGSDSKGSDFFYQFSVMVTGGLRFEIFARQKSLGRQSVRLRDKLRILVMYSCHLVLAQWRNLGNDYKIKM
jgi:hypothetical protein